MPRKRLKTTIFEGSTEKKNEINSNKFKYNLNMDPVERVRTALELGCALVIVCPDKEYEAKIKKALKRKRGAENISTEIKT